VGITSDAERDERQPSAIQNGGSKVMNFFFQNDERSGMGSINGMGTAVSTKEEKDIPRNPPRKNGAMDTGVVTGRSNSPISMCLKFCKV